MNDEEKVKVGIWKGLLLEEKRKRDIYQTFVENLMVSIARLEWGFEEGDEINCEGIKILVVGWKINGEDIIAIGRRIGAEQAIFEEHFIHRGHKWQLVTKNAASFNSDNNCWEFNKKETSNAQSS